MTTTYSRYPSTLSHDERKGTGYIYCRNPATSAGTPTKNCSTAIRGTSTSTPTNSSTNGGTVQHLWVVSWRGESRSECSPNLVASRCRPVNACLARGALVGVAPAELLLFGQHGPVHQHTSTSISATTLSQGGLVSGYYQLSIVNSTAQRLQADTVSNAAG